MDNPSANLISIGRVIRTQGHTGSMRMFPFFEPTDRFADLKSPELILELTTPVAASLGLPPSPPDLPAGHYPLLIEKFSFHQESVILRLQGVPDMDAAEKLRGAGVWVRRKNLWDLPEGEILVHELEGFAVVRDGNAERIGIVAGVLPGAAHDFLRVKREGTGREFHIPMVHGMVKQIATASAEVVVDLPPGLEDL